MSKREIKIVVGFVVVFAFLLAILAVAGALNTRSIRASQEAERQRRELASEEASAQAAEKHKNLLAEARVAAETPSKIAEAIALFEEAEKTDSVAGEDRAAYANVLKTRGEEKLEAGRLDEALADLRKAKTLAPNTEGLAPALEKASKIKAKQVELELKVVDAFVALKRKEQRTLPALNVCGTLERCVAVWSSNRKATRGESPTPGQIELFQNGEAYQFDKWHAAVAKKLKLPLPEVQRVCASRWEEIERRLAADPGSLSGR